MPLGIRDQRSLRPHGIYHHPRSGTWLRIVAILRTANQKCSSLCFGGMLSPSFSRGRSMLKDLLSLADFSPKVSYKAATSNLPNSTLVSFVGIETTCPMVPPTAARGRLRNVSPG